MQGQEDKDELGLYLFKTLAKNKMLAFKKIADNEFPLRMIPLDQLELFNDDDGFDHIFSQPSIVTSASAAKHKKKSKKSGKDQNTELI